MVTAQQTAQMLSLLVDVLERSRPKVGLIYLSEFSYFIYYNVKSFRLKPEKFGSTETLLLTE